MREILNVIISTNVVYAKKGYLKAFLPKRCICKKMDYFDVFPQNAVYVKKDPPREYSNGGFIYDGGRKFFIMNSMIEKKSEKSRKKLKK